MKKTLLFLLLNSPFLIHNSFAQTIGGGEYHSLALCSDSTVRAWGYNFTGVLGNGTNTESNVPVQVTGLCQLTTAVEEQQPENGFQIYPNPTTNHFIVSLGDHSKKVVLTITDLTGKIIYTIPIAIGTIETQEIELTQMILQVGFT